MASQLHQVPNAQGYNSPVPQQISRLFTAQSFEVLRDFYRKASLQNIATFDFNHVSDISEIPQKIIDRYFLSVPDNVGWEEFYNNSGNKSQNLDMSVSHQHDGTFLRFRIKLSKLDYDRMVGGGSEDKEIKAIFAEWKDVIREMAIAKLHLHLWNSMEERIINNVNPSLSGATAGFCDIPHNYGTDSSPIIGSPDEVAKLINHISEDFIRGNIMGEGETFFLKVPPSFIRLLASSTQANTLMHHRTDEEGRQFSDYWVNGIRSGITWGGAMLVPDYHMKPTPEGVYNIYGGWKENNLAKLYLTDVFLYPETTYGDQMVWLGMDAGFGTAVKRDDVTTLIKMEIQE